MIGAVTSRLSSPMRLLVVAAMFLAALASTPANAFIAIEAVPTAWRVQDFGDGDLHIFFTPSTCASGQLILKSTMPDGTKNRLWSLLLTAKITNKPVGILYDVVAGQCVIISFYMKEE